MAQKTVTIPGVGEVLLAKRRGSTHLRLSVTAKGVVRVGMPHWTPYAAGIAFARARADWINQQRGARANQTLRNGDRIGKAHKLNLIIDESLKTARIKLKASEIIVTSPWPEASAETQAKIRAAATRALKSEAQQLLPQRLEQLAAKHGFHYTSVRIRSLSSRWGSCSSEKAITLSYFLIQLPWELIDYVLLHELLHTRHMNHSAAFWGAFEELMPGAKAIRKQVNSHRPAVVAA